MTPMKQLAWLFAAAALVLGACATGAPIYNVTDAPIILAPGKTATMQQVQTAILRACTRWEIASRGGRHCAHDEELQHHVPRQQRPRRPKRHHPPELQRLDPEPGQGDPVRAD